MGDTKDGLGVVAFPVEDQQVRAGPAETMACEELVLAQLVVLGGRLPDMVRLNRVPEGHLQIVSQGVAGHTMSFIVVAGLDVKNGSLALLSSSRSEHVSDDGLVDAAVQRSVCSSG